MQTTQSQITFEELSKEWLLQKSIIVKKSTYVKYHNSLHKHINPRLGNFRLEQLNNYVIIEFTSQLLSADYSNDSQKLSCKTVKDLLLIINNILKYGRKYYPDKILPISIVYPKISKNNIRILSHAEQKALEKVLYQDMDLIKLGTLICLYTGLRIGEICALRWEDIIMDEEVIYIKRTVQRLQTLKPDSKYKTCLVIDTPKTSNSIRKIPIPEILLPTLKLFYAVDNTGFLLTNSSNNCMEPRTLENRFMTYVAEMNELLLGNCDNEYYSKLTFHSLRHTFATRCVEADVEIKCLSEILGHANVNITLNRYVHSSINMKRENMKKLSKFYQSKPSIDF